MLGRDYETWLEDQVGLRNCGYSNLFRVLANTDFTYQMTLDRNRELAGLQLRDRYSYEAGIYLSDVAEGPCSVLEMLVALCLDMCDQSLVTDPKVFFLDILGNLEVYEEYDGNFSEYYVKRRLDIWLERKYSRNGKGGILITKQPNVDMRKLDIWSQMSVFLNDFYPMNEDFLTN